MRDNQHLALVISFCGLGIIAYCKGVVEGKNE
jgi:hypothetical protein